MKPLFRYQRPLDVLPDAETKPIWSREEDVGLTAHEEEFELLLNSFEVIKAEALEVAKNMSNWDEVRKESMEADGY